MSKISNIRVIMQLSPQTSTLKCSEGQVVKDTLIHILPAAAQLPSHPAKINASWGLVIQEAGYLQT